MALGSTHKGRVTLPSNAEYSVTYYVLSYLVYYVVFVHTVVEFRKVYYVVRLTAFANPIQVYYSHLLRHFRAQMAG